MTLFYKNKGVSQERRHRAWEAGEAIQGRGEGCSQHLTALDTTEPCGSWRRCDSSEMSVR